jgi:glycosyltransferase involved in cell wall biosynthesis
MSGELVDFGLSVVIITHGRPELLRRTLASLAECELPKCLRQTLVVENGTPAGAEEVVNETTSTLRAKYCVVSSNIKTVSLNAALDMCCDDLVVFLDDDVRLSPQLLKAYADAAAEYGHGNYFGGPTGTDYEKQPPDWLRPFLPPSAAGFDLGSEQLVIKYPGCFLGFNWAAFASDLRRCGSFSRDLGPGTPVGVGDESFMQQRMNERGIVGRYVPEAMVWHYVPSERCSPKWALARARGSGITQGIFAEYWHRRTGEPLKKWRALLREFRRATAKTAITRLLAFRPDARFWLRHTLTLLIGFRNGISLGAIQRPLDDDVWLGGAPRDFR